MTDENIADVDGVELHLGGVGLRFRSGGIQFHDIPVRFPFLINMCISRNAIEGKVIEADALFLQVINGIHHNDTLLERKQRVGLLP